MTISLNFGIARQISSTNCPDARRLLSKELNRQLNRAGLPALPIVITLEVTPDADCDLARVHAHGAVATAGLSRDDLAALKDALCRAASMAVGAIGGHRQLVMKPMTCPSGWMDYCLEDQAKTRRALGIDDLWVMSRSAQQRARDHHREGRQRKKTG